MKSLIAGMCVVVAGYGTVFAGNTVRNSEIPAENVSGIATQRPDINVQLVEINKNPFAQKNLVVEMRDMVGKYIYTSGAAAMFNGQPAVDVDIPPLPKGVYSYSVYDEKDNLVGQGRYIKE